MPLSSDTFVAHTDLAMGQVLIQATYGPGVLVGFDAQENWLQVLHDGDRHATTYQLGDQGNLRLPDGRWVDGPPSQQQRKRMRPPPTKPTYVSANPLPIEAHGAFPLMKLADAPAQDTLRSIVQTMPVQPHVLREGPPGKCWHNPQWDRQRSDKFFLCNWQYGSRLSVAVRVRQVTDAAGQTAMHFMTMLPCCQDGDQVFCELDHIAIAPDGSEAIATLRWGDDMLFCVYLTYFYEHAPYLQAGIRYEVLVSGVVLDIHPSTQQSVTMEKPDWLDDVNAKIPTPLPLDAQGQFTLDVSQLRYLVPSQTDSPLAQFSGEVIWTQAFEFDPQVQPIYGTRGYQIEVYAATDSSDKKLRIQLLCPEKVLNGGWLPVEGDWIGGHAWLQGRLCGLAF
jgi:hypothetical protein